MRRRTIRGIALAVTAVAAVTIPSLKNDQADTSTKIEDPTTSVSNSTVSKNGEGPSFDISPEEMHARDVIRLNTLAKNLKTRQSEDFPNDDAVNAYERRIGEYIAWYNDVFPESSAQEKDSLSAARSALQSENPHFENALKAIENGGEQIAPPTTI